MERSRGRPERAGLLYPHGIELSQHDDGVFTAWHQARISRLIVPTPAPVKVPEPGGGYRVEQQQRWAVAWPAAINPVGAVEHLGEDAVAAAFTSAGEELGPREEAKREATLTFMRAVNAEVGSMPDIAPPTLPA